MERTRAYRRDVRNRAIRRKKRRSRAYYGLDWFKVGGAYSKGHIGCGCGLCKYEKHRKVPRLYEVSEREYIRYCNKDYEENQ